MSTMTKVFVVLSSVLSIALSVLFISVASQWSSWRDLTEKYKSERDAAVTSRQNMAATMEASLALKDDAISDLNRQLSTALGERDDLTEKLSETRSQLTVVTNERSAFDAGRSKLQEILNVTTGELKAAQKRADSLLAQNMDLQSRNNRLNARVLELTTNVTILTDQVRNIQEKLYACEQTAANTEHVAAANPASDTIAAPPGATAAQPRAAGEIKAEVVEIDGAYASINAGESSGVVVGMTFMVYREGVGYLGDLIIDTVRPNEAGGKLTTLVKGEVRRGDGAVHGMD